MVSIKVFLLYILVFYSISTRLGSPLIYVFPFTFLSIFSPNELSVNLHYKSYDAVPRVEVLFASTFTLCQCFTLIIKIFLENLKYLIN